MKAAALVFVVLFIATVAWRKVFVSGEQRRAVRSVLKEMIVALAVAFVGASGLFFIFLHNTVKVL